MKGLPSGSSGHIHYQALIGKGTDAVRKHPNRARQIKKIFQTLTAAPLFADS
jgi:hypothetical protein